MGWKSWRLRPSSTRGIKASQSKNFALIVPIADAQTLFCLLRSTPFTRTPEGTLFQLMPILSHRKLTPNRITTQPPKQTAEVILPEHADLNFLLIDDARGRVWHFGLARWDDPRLGFVSAAFHLPKPSESTAVAKARFPQQKTSPVVWRGATTV